MNVSVTLDQGSRVGLVTTGKGCAQTAQWHIARASGAWPLSNSMPGAAAATNDDEVDPVDNLERVTSWDMTSKILPSLASHLAILRTCAKDSQNVPVRGNLDELHCSKTLTTVYTVDTLSAKKESTASWEWRRPLSEMRAASS